LLLNISDTIAGVWLDFQRAGGGAASVEETSKKVRTAKPIDRLGTALSKSH